MDPIVPKAVFFAGLVVQSILRYPYERHRRQTAKTDRRITRSEQFVLGVLTVGVGILPLTYTFTDWLSFADYGLSLAARTAMTVVGTLLMLAGVWLFWRAHQDLGHNWSPSLEITAEQTLVTDGMYRGVRHPMYTSQLLFGLAQACLLHNWIAGPGGLITFFLLYLVRVPREERMLLDHFGGAYRDYAARTGRILPRIRRTATEEANRRAGIPPAA
jgi:protein-S-isoprenylcysteine O-methyltransferase Ste14